MPAGTSSPLTDRLAEPSPGPAPRTARYQRANGGRAAGIILAGAATKVRSRCFHQRFRRLTRTGAAVDISHIGAPDASSRRSIVKQRKALAEPAMAARHAGLRYMSDAMPGIRRVRRGDRFVYRGPDGRAVRDARELRRIAALAVPPAWTEVWIAPSAEAHLQATGRDARGRKQYRYHQRWRSVRDETKYAHIRSFGAILPQLRRRVARDLERPDLPREKVLAAVVRLMERTFARIGNPEYARENHSFGLTTLQNRHVRIRGGRIELDFRAKAGLRHHSVVADRKLASILRRCRDLPGSELFQYIDESGVRRSIDSADVNAYLREISGLDITAKDFRTWAASNLALFQIIAGGIPVPTKKQVAAMVKDVAARLGNTPAVCRKCYIHPGIVTAWQAGAVAEVAATAGANGEPALWSVERALLRLLDLPEAALAATPADARRLLRRKLERSAPGGAGAPHTRRGAARR
jgi:DNA topoisomerase I